MREVSQLEVEVAKLRMRVDETLGRESDEATVAIANATPAPSPAPSVDVVREVVEHAQAPRIAAGVRDRRDVAERAHGRATRLTGAHASGDLLVHVGPDVRVELTPKISVYGRSTEERAQTKPYAIDPALHGRSPGCLRFR